MSSVHSMLCIVKKYQILQIFTAIGLVALLAGCQSFVQTPIVHVAGITYADITKSSQTIGVRFEVKNPNLFSIPIQSGFATMSIDGRQFARGAFPHAVTLPAASLSTDGTAQVTVPIHANFGALENDVIGIMIKGSADYRITGQVSVREGSGMYPFSYHGVLTSGQVKQMISNALG